MNEFSELLGSILILIGVIFMWLCAIAIIRFPDFYIRNSMTTTATALGISFLLLGIAIHFNDIEVLLEILGIAFFIFLISPVASHITARAALKNRVPFSKQTNLDQLGDYKEKRSNSKQQD